MVKENEFTIIVIIIIIGLIIAVIGFTNGSSFLGAVTGSETMTRTLPSSVAKGSTFTLTYNAVGTSGDYGVSVQDSISGGCTVTSMSNWKFVLTSPATTYQLTVTAPNNPTTCVFSGDYKYGDKAQVNFPSQSVVVDCIPNWQASAWSSCGANCNWVGKDNCLGSYSESGTQTRTVTDANNCGVQTNKPLSSQACTITCTRVVPKSGVAPLSDRDCDGKVDRTELGVDIQGWSSGTITRDQLGLAIQAWSGGN